MTAPPLPFMYEGDGRFAVLPRAKAECAEHYGQGEVVMLAPVEERSEVSHRHEFAWLREAWQNLPDHLAREYPSAEHLRKTALIRTGWCSITDYPCGTHAEAMRWARNIEHESDPYAIVEVSASVVRVFKARSQARGKMKPDDFKASKDAVLGWVSNLLGVEPDELERARAA